MFNEWKGKRVTVMGLGLHGGGVGATGFFAKAGAKVTVTDLKSRRELAPSIAKLKGLPIQYVLGRHRAQDFIEAGLVIQNPGVPAESPYLKIARRHGVPIDTDVGVFFQNVPRGRIIGVTGTKGKSTTAALVAAMLKKKFPGTILAGNIRTSVLEALPQVLRSKAPVVLELSSWQLEGLAPHKKSPRLAVITSVFPEHLNRYPSMHAYAEAKKHIVRFQEKEDIAVLNRENKIIRGLARGIRPKIIWFSSRDALPYQRDIKVPGRHNLSNVAAVIAIAKLYGVPQNKIREALRNFEGLEGRLEIVAKKRGVRFYNDTTATAPDATIAALKSFSELERVILIAGGTDKNLDYRPVAQFLTHCPPKATVFLPGSATEKLQKALGMLRSESVKDMGEAVRTAWQIAQKGDIILLSPGAASFGLFQHEFDRGEQFVREVRRLK